MATSQSKPRNEAAEQARLIKWASRKAVRDLMPALRWLFHVPNGGKRDSFTGGQMKAMGVKPGVPDLLLPVRSGACPGLVIEMKNPDGSGRASDEQLEWLAHFTEQEWATAICNTAEHARQVLCEYLQFDPAAIPALDP